MTNCISHYLISSRTRQPGYIFSACRDPPELHKWAPHGTQLPRPRAASPRFRGNVSGCYALSARFQGQIASELPATFLGSTCCRSNHWALGGPWGLLVVAVRFIKCDKPPRGDRIGASTNVGKGQAIGEESGWMRPTCAFKHLIWFVVSTPWKNNQSTNHSMY